MGACNDSLWLAWLSLATLQATFCGSFMLQPHQDTPTRANYKPAGYCRPAIAQRNLNFLRSRPPLQLSLQSTAPPAAMQPMRRPTALLASPARRSIWVSAVLPLSGAGDKDAGSSGGGGGLAGKQSAGNSTGSTRTIGVATDEAAAVSVQTETQRLMSVPTIDIKLELQMRGVEHRDAFEKVDLARRLAEARASCPSLPAASAATEDKNDANDGLGARDYVKPRGASTKAPGNESEDTAQAREEDNDLGAASPEGGSASYARDVAKATRMGKAAVVRELNAMGIAHSRLSDVSVLARLYASGRREAREDAEAARRFPRVAHAARSSSSSSSSYANEGKGQGGGEGRAHGEEEREGSGRGGGEEEERWSSTREQWSRATSGLPWNAGKKEDDDKDEEEEDGKRRPATNGEGGSVPWNKKGEESAPVPFGDDRRDGSETDWSIGANAGSVVSSGGGGDGSGDKGRSRKASLHARADRMSSRELMKALDDLGARYRIPAPRLELQQAFVSAVLTEDQRNHGGAAAAGTRGDDGRERAEIVPLSPYAATEDEEEELDGGNHRRKAGAGFGTYHSALRWARQLNFDDVLEELKYRGVKCNPRADYSYLTRLLADEVLADEELMEAEGVEGTYNAEVEVAMSMSAQEIIRELREGGERADVTLSKEALAEKLAEMNLRLRGESLPHSGSGDAFYRQRRPEGGGREGRGDHDDGRRERKGFGLGASAGVSEDLLGHDGSVDGEDVLLELEEAAKSVGGAAMLVAKETAAFVSETAAGLFPDIFPEEDGRGNASPSAEQQRQRRMHQAGRASAAPPPGGGGGGGGDRERATEQARRARAVRERAGGVRRAATGFAQSSVNRAGFAVAQSVVNGVLKGAEAAADWAGDGALAREYVLLIVATFCLVFKRGVGSAVALLVLIRFGRITAQKLVAEGWKVERAKRARARDGGDRAAAAAGGGGSTTYRRDTPSARYTATTAAAAAATGRRPRRGKAAAAGAAKTEEKKRRPRPKNTKKVKRKPVPSRRRRTEKSARKPLWESDSDNDDGRGCVVS